MQGVYRIFGSAMPMAFPKERQPSRPDAFQAIKFGFDRKPEAVSHTTNDWSSAKSTLLRTQGDGFRRAQTSLDRQLRNFALWAEEKKAYLASQPHAGWTYVIPAAETPQLASGIRERENQRTLKLFKQTFPTFMWTGIECSNPLLDNQVRWDELEKTNFYDPGERKRQIQLMRQAGIYNIRLGMPNHKMAAQKSWGPMDAIMKSFRDSNRYRPKDEQIKISLDLLHFGLPDRFRKDDPTQSLFLNPEWPAYFVKTATQAVNRYFNDLSAITLINEPLITNVFSSGRLNEAYPGANHPAWDHFYIKRAMLMAKAALKARIEIERILKEKGERRIFIHNDSCERVTDNPVYNNLYRYVPSDLILGHEWLLEGDFTQSDMYKWLESRYVDPARPETRDELLNGLREIRGLHEQFQKEFKKTTKADTVFGLDYYPACERGPGISGKYEDYPAELKAGTRRGLYGMGIDFWNRYKLPLLHTETNMVNHLSDKWGMQQLLELAELQKTGIPVLGFNWYSLMDQYGWDKGLAVHPDEASRNHLGLFSTRDYDMRLFTRDVLPDLLNGLNNRLYFKQPEEPEVGGKGFGLKEGEDYTGRSETAAIKDGQTIAFA